MKTGIPNSRETLRRRRAALNERWTAIRQRRGDAPHEHGSHDAVAGGRAVPAEESQAPFVLLKGLDDLITNCGRNLEAIIQGMVDLLPRTSRYPSVCCARVLLRGRSHTSSTWHDSPWRIVGELRVNQQPVGTVEMAYLEHRPQADEGPFTRGDRTILNFIAALLSKSIERLGVVEQLNETVRQLELEREALRQANTTLHGILTRIDEERKSVRRTITANVDKVLMPILSELESRAEPRIRGMLDLLRHNLEEIASPFVDRLSRMFSSLTPLEIALCRMIRDNLTTKEIARIRHVSPATVARQREHIRVKLGIARSDANLATYLRTFLVDDGDSGPYSFYGQKTLPPLWAGTP